MSIQFQGSVSSWPLYKSQQGIVPNFLKTPKRVGAESAQSQAQEKDIGKSACPMSRPTHRRARMPTRVLCRNCLT